MQITRQYLDDVTIPGSNYLNIIGSLYASPLLCKTYVCRELLHIQTSLVKLLENTAVLKLGFFVFFGNGLDSTFI